MAGCTSTRWTYDKPSVTPARLDQDLADCRRVARTRQGLAIFQANRVDRELFNRCMERKGYTVSVEP